MQNIIRNEYPKPSETGVPKTKEWTGKTIYLDFSSIFGVIEKESKKTDEKGRVRADAKKTQYLLLSCLLLSLFCISH